MLDPFRPIPIEFSVSYAQLLGYNQVCCVQISNCYITWVCIYPEAGGESLHERDGCVDLVRVFHYVGDVAEAVVTGIPQVLLMLFSLLSTVEMLRKWI